MASKTRHLKKQNLLINPPHFLDTGVQYEVIMGSIAYGVSNDNSDMDIYGFAIPPRDTVFPHLQGYIHGFDQELKPFNQFQQHKIQDASGNAGKGREYDLTIYSIIKYFRLLADCNPNIIDTLFVPRRCVIYSTALGELIRENRHLFLHKGCWPTFKGYAYAQMHKMKTKQPEGNRVKLIEKYGYDVKFAYHVVRLLNEIEQIMAEGDLELDKNSEQLKAIRRGEWNQHQIETYFYEKEKSLETLYTNSTLPIKADHNAIKDLLLHCLEQHYGTLENCISSQDKNTKALNEIKKIVSSLSL
ncbi:DNA polymerase beta superfamily protein [Teredinibacter sp. KSP-S5-2]|uniref:nucleotidyltransferase domain-containing protein n=1 Tax=Teredinibacter sp. KSP-S5-2 TaxID=3034506 RepID=UPI002934FA33|nr:nucleotidyltransferase domain-containing protein [Teredinibacter sp. KSP-S5-2]WNO10846.1 nucleotidyltransferase domain-containing protein [Teredinibacter sp. KSP-S5-2]